MPSDKQARQGDAWTSMLCLKTRSGFERLIFRLAASASIDDKTNIACFSSLGVARDRLCQAKNRSISHPTTEFSDRAYPKL